MVRFCSLDFFRRVQDVANSDAEFLTGARGFNATFTYRVTDRLEELPPIFMRFADGRVVEVREAASGEKTDFTLEGPYNIWMGVNKGEIDGATAIMTRQMRLLGSMGAIIKFGKAFRRLLAVMASVQVEY
jgi:putative sterol carrier protein